MKDGGPAFWDGVHGVTVRDYFAAKAMQGLLSHSCDKGTEWKDAKELSERAYKIADTMLAEREKEG